MKRFTSLGCLLTACFVQAIACGGDEPKMQAAPVQGGQVATAAGSSTGIALAGNIALPAVGCDTSIMSELRCGGIECAPLPANAGSCVVNCCTGTGKCGTRITASINGMAVTNMCIESAVADPACPSSSFGGIMTPGCCDMTGHCGQLTLGVCIALGNGATCGAGAAARENDAGI